MSHKTFLNKKHMRYRSIHKWKKPTECVGLLYFAQLMEELIFDYTNSTYKYSVMHSGTLAQEALSVLKEINNGNIKTPNINHICAELADNINRDIVASRLISIDAVAYIGTLKNPKSKPNEIKPIVELLALQLSRDEYLTKNIELLIDEVEHRQDLITIRRLTRSFITTLIAIGYSQKHIEKTLLEYFYPKNNTFIDNPTAIRGFIQKVIQNEREYKYIFRVSRLFDEAKEACSKRDIEIVKTLPPPINDLVPKKFAINIRTQSYAIVDKVNARDIYRGRE